MFMQENMLLAMGKPSSPGAVEKEQVSERARLCVNMAFITQAFL